MADRATCPVCGRNDIIVNRGTMLPRLRKHKPTIFRGRNPNGTRKTSDWCKGSGRAA